ncbi:MAG: helix-turn-helix domain-containing protein, partial [Draconibacterium sp.]|nr:helix-turn-helix domain-containing protein [Draconibacterium sp.]
LYFSYDILYQLNKTCSKKLGFWNNIIDFSNDRILLIKVFSIIIFSIGIMSLFQGVLEILNRWQNAFYIAESIGVIVIGYWFLFVIIYNPKIIHFKMKEIKAQGKLLSYEKSGLEEEEAVGIMKKMNSWMEKEKPYVDGNLSLADFAEKFEIPGYILSEVLNRLLKQNFYEYVNNYRIEEFKRLVQDPKNKNIKLLNIAFDVGFNSKTTFNTSFKKFTGKTPSEYRRSLN